MKVQYCSDLHLEFPENKIFMEKNPLVAEGEVLLLAGDILPFALLDKKWDFFDFVSDHFKTVYWVPGNHEYYHSDISKRSGVLHEKIRENVFLVNDYDVTINDIHFVFTTLWGNISTQHQWSIQQSIADFSRIKMNGKRFIADDFNTLHARSRVFLEKSLAESGKRKTVVVTHHVPTFLNYPEEYRNDALNEAFAVEMHDFIEPSGIDYWIYGHHHRNIPDFAIGRTRLATNQLGYVRHGEHGSFRPNTTLNININD
ncbi:MAG TPA: metallophosphoesterase [Flavobacteriales bacterium]|nr:metallophosphoesterase [Flavobacteriales bacterium]HRE74314.1 metallophosphoesterase [Flavobacteriales bacterium]HRE97930.1 metallophosphoesterase [Flavobacteriales bacterium]